jgi:hypothetical protein
VFTAFASAALLEEAPTVFVGFAPGGALDLDPVGLVAGRVFSQSAGLSFRFLALSGACPYGTVSLCLMGLRAIRWAA